MVGGCTLLVSFSAQVCHPKKPKPDHAAAIKGGAAVPTEMPMSMTTLLQKSDREFKVIVGGDAGTRDMDPIEKAIRHQLVSLSGAQRASLLRTLSHTEGVLAVGSACSGSEVDSERHGSALAVVVGGGWWVCGGW